MFLFLITILGKFLKNSPSDWKILSYFILSKKSSAYDCHPTTIAAAGGRSPAARNEGEHPTIATQETEASITEPARVPSAMPA